MIVAIPFQDYPYFSEQVTLDSVPYVFEFCWNNRGSFWSLTIYDKNNNLLIAGLKVVKNLNLLNNYGKRDILPEGLLVAQSQADGDNTEIAYGDIYIGLVNIVYIPRSDFATL